MTGPDTWNSDSRQRWSAARLWAAHQVPYLATALFALEPVVVAADAVRRNGLDLSAFPVDTAWQVYLDEDVLAATTIEVVGFWLVHQASHLLRHHSERAPTATTWAPGGDVRWSRTPDQLRWNLACDLEIDDDLVVGDVVLPEEAAVPDQLGFTHGCTAETYYDELGGRRSSSDVVHVGDPCRRFGPVDCGSGADGRPRPWDGTAGPGSSPVVGRLLERQVAQAISQHQRNRGDVPAGWLRWADEVLEPTVNWRGVLASAVRRGVADVVGRVDFTYQKPSRRAASLPNVILPSLRQRVPNAAVVLDTSASMSDMMLGQCLAEVTGVLATLGIARHQLRIVCCDAKAYEAQRVLRTSDVTLLGGGGTDLEAGLRYATELRPRPEVIIVLTDGETPWPERPPAGVEVVVVLLGVGPAPTWARTVLVPLKESSQT